MIKITKQTIRDRVRQFCAENGKNYDFLMEFNGGEDGFVAKVVEIDSRALSVKNRRLISGMPFECSPTKRCNDNGLVYWAADTGYIGCDSAEVVCRGGWMNDEKADGEVRYFLEDDKGKVKPIPEAEYEI